MLFVAHDSKYSLQNAVHTSSCKRGGAGEEEVSLSHALKEKKSYHRIAKKILPSTNTSWEHSVTLSDLPDLELLDLEPHSFPDLLDLELHSVQSPAEVASVVVAGFHQSSLPVDLPALETGPFQPWIKSELPWINDIESLRDSGGATSSSARLARRNGTPVSLA